MANSVSTKQLIIPSEPHEINSPDIEQADSSFLPLADSGTPWNFSTILALFLLVVVWTVKLYTTWGAWGNLTVDSGHEMYVPAMLAEGKVLYRDVSFTYGPGAPYFTSYLFRLFGERLNVLYWAGSLSALGSAIFLYLIGMRLSSWPVGWTAGAVVLMEAFQPSMFCFPLPYASAAVYGCLTGCAFLWIVVNASFSRSWFWMFSAGMLAAAALLLKPEFGIACYGTLACLVAARAYFGRSWSSFAGDVIEILPGVILCGLVIRWMVSIAGVEFITQENILSWPTNYFMRVYGKRWLERTGFTVSGSAFHGAMMRAIPVSIVVVVLYGLLRWRSLDKRSLLIKALVILAAIGYFIKEDYFVLSMRQSVTLLLSTVFFPRDMVLYVIVAAGAAWAYFWWGPGTQRNLAIALVLTFSSLLAFRILMMMNTTGYSVFYNGPALLSYILLLSIIIFRANRSRRFVFLGESVLCLACLAPVFVHTRAIEAGARDYIPLSTDRGTVRVPQPLAESYKAAIQFMKEKAALGQSVLSVPEDTSLYFLSGTYCPTRVYLFIPGSVAPGKMTDKLIAEIEQKRVGYLLWSNRTFSEYQAREFGTDFDTEIGDYLKSHYRPVRGLIPDAGAPSDWAAVVWERKPEREQ